MVVNKLDNFMGATFAMESKLNKKKKTRNKYLN